jgi:hypothetical protein
VASWWLLPLRLCGLVAAVASWWLLPLRLGVVSPACGVVVAPPVASWWILAWRWLPALTGWKHCVGGWRRDDVGVDVGRWGLVAVRAGWWWWLLALVMSG